MIDSLPTPQETDAGVASGRAAFSRALSLSFTALKIALAIGLFAVVLSGTRRVGEGTVAVRTFFGAIARAESGEAEVLEPGGPYFWPPAPIGEFIDIDTTLRSLALESGEDFYLELKPGEELLPVERLSPRPLVPGRDGYLLASDGGIVHARFRVDYRVAPSDAGRFALAFGRGRSSLRTETAAPSRSEAMHGSTGDDRAAADSLDARAARLLRSIAREAIVHVAAQTPADRIVQGGLPREAIRERIQTGVDALRCGLTIERVLVEPPVPPLAVLDAFQSASLAEAERSRRIEGARRRAEELLAQTAGARANDLVAALARLEAARANGDDAAAAAAESALLAALDPEELAGDAAERLRAAIDRAQSAEERIFAEREEFLGHLAAAREAPAAWRRRHAQTAFEALLSGDVETFWLPAGDSRDLEIEIGRDPRVREARESARYRSEATRDPR